MEITIFNNTNYYRIKDVMAQDYKCFIKGKNERDFQRLNKIPEDSFLYARFTTEWNINDGKSKKFDNVFIKQSYIDTVTTVKKINKFYKNAKGTRINVITVNNINYMLVNDIMTNAPIYSKKYRTDRELVAKKELNHVYLRLIFNQWIVSDGSSNKVDKVAIELDEAVTIPEINGEDKIKVVDDVPRAPKLLELEDDEKFKDKDGKSVEVETRGNKTHNEIYFKVNDIAKLTDKQHLYKTIIHPESDYVDKIHYKYFICDIKKELFLTYQGVLKVIFNSKNNNNLILWATKTLFTVQMGSENNKTSLASKLSNNNQKLIDELNITKQQHDDAMTLKDKDIKIAMLESSVTIAELNNKIALLEHKLHVLETK